jgi:hypothetical protein
LIPTGIGGVQGDLVGRLDEARDQRVVGHVAEQCSVWRRRCGRDPGPSGESPANLAHEFDRAARVAGGERDQFGFGGQRGYPRFLAGFIRLPTELGLDGRVDHASQALDIETVVGRMGHTCPTEAQVQQRTGEWRDCYEHSGSQPLEIEDVRHDAFEPDQLHAELVDEVLNECDQVLAHILVGGAHGRSAGIAARQHASAVRVRIADPRLEQRDRPRVQPEPECRGVMRGRRPRCADLRRTQPRRDARVAIDAGGEVHGSTRVAEQTCTTTRRDRVDRVIGRRDVDAVKAAVDDLLQALRHPEAGKIPGIRVDGQPHRSTNVTVIRCGAG